MPDPRPGSGPGAPPSPWLIGAAWTALLALAWVALTLNRPSATFHLVPLLLAGSWPLLVAQGPRPGRPGTRQVLEAGGLATGVTLVETAILATTHRLQGEAFLGGDHAVREALVLAVLGGGLGVLLGLLLVRRGSSRARP